MNQVQKQQQQMYRTQNLVAILFSISFILSWSWTMKSAFLIWFSNSVEYLIRVDVNNVENE